MKFAFDPIPHAEAAKMIAGKPAIFREIFDDLQPEMKLRAFTISGVEEFDILQGVRDQIAKLPAGADWADVKQRIARDISPWFDEGRALRRAELLMRHHAFSAYSAAEARINDAQTDIFPYRQYLSAGDGKVRDTHRALHGKILPASHPFWADHTPPWEYNCRCQVVPLTAEDADEERTRDAKRIPENQRVVEGPALTLLEGGRVMTPAGNVQLAPSLQRTRDFNIPYEELASRWDTTVRAYFEKWASKLEVEGANLLDKLKGIVTGRRKKKTTNDTP